MALRVLGYKTVIEAKGTWPTNYIAKAEELDLLEDITYGTYAAGSTRGNTALLIWNMLRLPMWDVTAESEGDGLMYQEQTEGCMLNKKFKDYHYDEDAIFRGFEIKDGKVEVDLNGDWTDLEYLGNDFYTFVYGSEVEVLINKDDKTLLTMFPNGEDKLVEGKKDDIDEDYDELYTYVFDYGYGLVVSKKITNSSLITVDSEYIYDVNTSNKKAVKFNKNTNLRFAYEDAEEMVFLKDGERATIKDVKVGDVLTAVYVTNGANADTSNFKAATFYMIGGSEVEGKLTKVEDVAFDHNETKYTVVTIDKEVYSLDKNAVSFEDGEDIDTKALFSADVTNYGDVMEGEVVVAKLDALGKVAAFLFDGEFDSGKDEDEDTYALYAFTDDVDGYSIAVENENGSDTLDFAKKSFANTWRYEDLMGTLSIVALDKDGEIAGFSGDNEETFMLRADDSGDLVKGKITLPAKLYTNKAESEYYNVALLAKADYDDDKSALVEGSTELKVGASTVVITLIFDDKGTTSDKDDEFRVEFSEGTEAIENLNGKDDDVAVVLTENKNFARASYVVIFDEVSSREEDLLGILVSTIDNKIGDDYVAISDVRLTDDEDIEEAEKDALIFDGEISSLKDYEFIVYSTEENKDGELEVTFENGFRSHEFLVDEPNHGFIDKSTDKDDKNVSDDGRSAMITANGKTEEWDFNSEEMKDLYEDKRIVILTVEVDENDTTDKQYHAVSFEEVAYADAELKELDRISLKIEDMVVIIRGMADRPE